MNYLYVGTIHSPHGIKGEIKVKTDLEYADQVFYVHNHLYIGPNKIEKEITSHRIHKGFHLITLKELDSIEEVISLIGMDVYIDKSEIKRFLKDNEYLIEDLIGLNVKNNNKNLGTIIDVVDSGNNNLLLKIKGETVFFYPFKLIEKVSLKDNIIEVVLVDGLL